MNKELDEDRLLADSSDDGSSSSDDEETRKFLGLQPVHGHGHGQGQAKDKKRASAASFFQKDSVDGAKDSSDSDENSSEDEEERMEVDEDTLQLELDAVNDKLAAEPYSYDLHLEKIRVLKGLGEIGRLRDARERMSKLYPLSPSLWTEWTQDERKVMASDEEKEYVVSLFERAVKDYSSVDLWLEYINFCLSRMGEEGGVGKCREIFERALGNCGLHVAMGSLIWDTYRDFEGAVLSTMSAENEEQQLEQEKRYIALCKRQLAVPLLDMETTYEQLGSKIEIDETTKAAYNKALERLHELENWEAKLVQTSDDTAKVQVYNEYISEEIKAKVNPARIQCLYERAVTDSPLSVSLWLDYIDYLSKHLKIAQVIQDVAERSSRNCPWLLSIWTKYLWVVETFMLDENSEEKQFEKIKTIFETALSYCGTIVDQVGTLWLKYVEYLRRRINYENPDSKKVEILRKTFAAAEAHILQLVREPNDFVSQILQFRARFEAAVAKKMTDEVREIWKDIFHRGYGQNFRVWSQYIMQEIRYEAEIKKIRSELNRAMGLVKDDPQSAADLWLNFERDYGDLTTLSAAEIKIAKELEKSAYTMTVNHVSEYGQKFQDKGKKRKYNDDSYNAVPPKKGKTLRFNSVDSVDSKNNDDGEFKMPSAPPPKKTFKNNNNFDNNKQTKNNSNGDDSKTNNFSTNDPKPKPSGLVKHDPSKDNQTVFVSNLVYKVDEEQLKIFFEEVGKVEEIRLARDFKGKSKGFGYVVFTKSEVVPAALALDRKPLEDRPVFVSKCDPDKATRQPQFKYANQLEKNKLFVKGLPLSMTQEDVQKMFEEFGTVKDCRLVTRKDGHSKGIAYVDFQTNTEASAAILKTDGKIINGSPIAVALSNPPSKNAVKSLPFFSSAKGPDPGLRRERNVFVPRSLQVRPGSTSKPEDSTASTEANSNKSNDYFRKLFTKQ